MVRLKLKNKIEADYKTDYFNPTMVRLKQCLSEQEVDRCMIFQSHNGSIKTHHQSIFHLGLPNFNPTMVRLKPFRLLGDCLYNSDFNPTMVRLKLNIYLPIF